MADFFSFNEYEFKKILKNENYMDDIEKIYNEEYKLEKEENEYNSSIPKKKKTKDNDMER